MLRPLTPAAVGPALAIVFSLSAAGQFRYKTGIDVAGFTVTVSDREGLPITDLTAEDFDVREDGTPQTVSYFSHGDGIDAVPLHIGLLFDTSESMEKELAFSRTAAIRFLKTFPKAVDFTLVEFATDVRAARFSQIEFSRLVERIRKRPAKGYTALYDALGVYLGSAFDQTGRKVLVLYTDGGDTSSVLSWPSTLRLLRTADVTVYPIGFLTQRSSGQMLDKARLLEMARLTGGQALFPAAIKDLDAIYDRIADEIRAQYVLGYVSSNTARDGKWRNVEIRIKRASSERLQVRTREGYFAPVR
jgi:Ca-activated chloride channel family protein